MKQVKRAIVGSSKNLRGLHGLQVAGVVAAAVVGAIAVPVLRSRWLEYLVHFSRSPVRTIAESVVLFGSLGSVYAEVIGFRPFGAFIGHLSRKITIPAGLALGAISYLSFRNGISPPPGELDNLEGKLALLTGVTNGIGRKLVERLAIQGANLILIARDQQAISSLVQELKQLNPRITVVALIADLEDLKEVGSLPIAQNAPNGIDILVLNAGGVPAVPARFGGIQNAGLESSITSMHLSHALLTKMSWNLLNPNARVVITSSIAHSGCPSVDTVFQEITSEDSSSQLNTSWDMRYSRAKFANALFARQLGRLAQQDPRAIRVSSHHPGGVATNLWSNYPRWINALLNVLLRTSDEGAVTLIDAAAGRNFLHGQETAPNGSYYVSSTLYDRGYRFNTLLHDPEAARELWNRTDSLITTFGPQSASWTYKGPSGH